MTKKMEVHHHPQLHHQPKPWKEYLLEGLMIFLAVMMGFVAESLRERNADEHHVRQLTISLVKDLKNDTTRLSHLITTYNRKLKAMDSLYYLLQQPLPAINTYKLQKLVQSARNEGLFTSENGTIAQLKNSGFLRLLSETEVPHQIGRYEGLVAVTKTLEASDFEYGKKYLENFVSQHFTPQNLFALSNTASSLKDSFEPVNSNMRNITRENLTQFSTDLM